MKKIYYIMLFIICMFLFCDKTYALNYEVYVGDKQVTDSNKTDVFNDGKVSYDSETNTLTLNNYTISSSRTVSDEINLHSFSQILTTYANSIYSSETDGLKINLVGNNKIIYNDTSSSAGPFYVYSAISSSNLLEISGNGSLEIEIHNGNYVFGLYSFYNKINVSNTTIKTNVKNTFDAKVIYGSDDILINNSKITMEFTDTIYSNAVYLNDSDKNVTIDSSTFDINIGDGDDCGETQTFRCGYIDIIESTININVDSDSYIQNFIIENQIKVNKSKINMDLYAEEDITGFDCESITFTDSKVYVKSVANTSNTIICSEDNGDIFNSTNSTFDFDIKGADAVYGFKYDQGNITNSKIYIKERSDTESYGIYSTYSKVTNSTVKIDSDYKSLNALQFEIYGGLYVLNRPLDVAFLYFYNITENDIFVSNNSFSDLSVIDSKYNIKNYQYAIINVLSNTYEYLEGKDKDIDPTNLTSYKLKIDAEYVLFNNIKIDNVTYTLGTDYKVSEGSTVIEFTNTGLAKIKSLSTGKHNVEVDFLNNKKANTTLNIIEKENQDETKETDKIKENVTKEANPKTGDNIITSIIFGITSLICLVGIIIYVKKKNK